jgi:hypothetical protein
MKMKTRHSHLNLALGSVLLALFFVPLATLSASPQDIKSAITTNGADLRVAPTAEEARDAALAAAKERAAAEAARFAPAAVPAAIPRPARPAAPNGPPIFVTATAGTLGPTPYANLGAAFTAINAGTHQGDITISVAANSAETGPAVLNSTGAGSASYTSVLIRPTADAVSISGATVTGRGLIELNGADNVTIDGDNPSSGGINRDLTIQNTAASTITFTSVVRIALATSVVTTANNDTLKNCNIIGSSPGRNIATATTTTGTENTTFGFIAGAGASTVSATTAPSAITSVSTTVGSPATATNLVVSNNSFSGSMARAVNANGSATTVFPGLQVTNNVIGNATAGSVDQVTAIGVTVQGSANAVISGNTVYVEGFIASSSATHGINVGVNSTGVSGATIDSNKISRIRNNNGQSWSAFGINLGGGNNHIVQNNFVFDVRNDQTAGTGAFSNLFGAFGIRVASGTGHKIYHNSVHLFGAVPGTTSADLIGAFTITSTTLTGVDVRNNIFSNIMTGGNPTQTNTRLVAVNLPSAGTSAMNLTWNNNDYVEGTDANSRMAQVGTTAGTGEFTAANFDPTMTTPPTNFRSYTSTLSAAGTNDNGSKKVDPQFVSNTDLHIAVASPMVDMGANVGVGLDIDGQARVGVPDIGADEPSGITPPANDIAATAFLTPTDGATVLANSTTTPQASFKNVGTATQTNVMVQFAITGPGGYNYSNPQTIASIAPNQTINVSFAVTPPFATPGTYNMTATVTTPDANSANDQIAGSFSVLAPLAGSYNVPGDYASLSNNGGIFAALNAAGASANITINITADLTGETGTNALNELAGGFTVLIKPSGGPRSITGSNGATAIVRINGADGVTINGSTTASRPTGAEPVGGNPALRELTIQNTNTAATAAAVVMVSEGTNGAQNVTIKNVNIVGQDPTQTLIGLHIGGNAVGTSPTTANNNNARVENCSFRKTFVGIFDNGISAANAATGHVLTQNDMTGTGANRLRRVGIFMFFQNGVQITANDIGGISTDEAADGIGIVAGIQNVTTTSTTSGGVFNALISRNRINSVAATSTTGFSAVGIAIAGDPAGANTVSNNMISGVISPATSPDLVAGIFVAGVTGSNTKVYDNSVSMTGDRGTVASQIGSYAIAISGTNPIVDLKGNIFFNTQTSGGGANAKSYALGMTTTTANMSNLMSNFNDLFTSGANASFTRTGSLDTSGTDQANLAAWQAASGKDPNSISADPLFVSTSNLHLTCASPAQNVGTPLVAVPDDFDGQVRSLSLPEIGADEITAPAVVSAVSRKVHGAAGPFDINLPSMGLGVECRTGGGTNAYEIVVTFGSAVNAAGASVTAGTGMVDMASGNGTNTITIDLSGVTNAQVITVTLSCVDDGVNRGDVSVSMGVLVGDTSGNGSVNASDINQTKARSGQGTDGTNFRSDVTANGSINATDINLVKVRSGTSLP